MNKTYIAMYNFFDSDYLDLLKQIVSYFSESKFSGFDDTMIRFDENEQVYVASVYVLDDEDYKYE